MEKIECNKLDRAFGPTGFYAGIVLVFVGIIASIYALPALVLIIVGAFTAFTDTCTFIDYDNKKVKFSSNFFGIFKVGPWVDVTPRMKLDIKKNNQSWGTYSRSNRKLEIPNVDYRIRLLGPNNREILTLKKNPDYEGAKVDMETIGKLLGLSVI